VADVRYREQYTDAVGTHIRDQERAGLDIVTDGTPGSTPTWAERRRPPRTISVRIKSR
jgi:hypothetical protein